jgi:hypothetical protein
LAALQVDPASRSLEDSPANSSWMRREATAAGQSREALAVLAAVATNDGGGMAVATGAPLEDQAEEAGQVQTLRASPAPAGQEHVSEGPRGGAAEKYTVPAATSAAEKAFSSTYKARIGFRNAWIFLGLLTVTPALIALASRYAYPQGWWIGGVYAAGWLATLAVTLAWANSSRSWEAKSLRARLLEKVSKEGVDPNGWGGRFVGIGPHAEPRTYEHQTVWDIGYFFIYPDRLCFWGEEAHFALYRQQITDVRVAAGPPGWIRTASVYISWRDGELMQTLNLRPGDVATVREMARETRFFGAKLTSWMQQKLAYRELPPILASLGPPRFGAVTGAMPGSGARGQGLRRSLTLMAALGWAIGVICGMPFISLQPPGGWYVVVTAWSVFLLHLIPLWRRRDPELTDRRT